MAGLGGSGGTGGGTGSSGESGLELLERNRERLWENWALWGRIWAGKLGVGPGQDWGYWEDWEGRARGTWGPLTAESGLGLLEGDWENCMTWVGGLGVLENQDRENGGRTGRTGRIRRSRTGVIWGALTGESGLELEERDWARATGSSGGTG